MNEEDIKSYMLDPKNTSLNGFIFLVNYSILNSTVKEELVSSEDITSIHSQYKPKFFNALYKITTLSKDGSDLRKHLFLDYEAVKTIYLKNYDTQIFNFHNSNHLFILSGETLLEVEELNPDNFEIKVFSLDDIALNNLKTEIFDLYNTNPNLFSAPKDTSCKNSRVNEIYVQVLLNFLIEDYNFISRSYSLIDGLDVELRKMFFGLVKKINHALVVGDEALYIGSISLMSLIIENRLAHIYELEVGEYEDDKTLGQLIGQLDNGGHLYGIQPPLKQFKEIRNNIIHCNKHTYNIFNSFVESIKHLGQFIIWCKENGKL